jgi:FHA domain
MATIWTCLVRIKTNDEDRTHLIEKTSFMIGRTEDADLPLTEASVSRSHLNVELRGPNIFVTDMKSGNGTMINGQKIEPGVAIALTPNDVIRIGLAPHEFQIVSIPKPFEMLDAEMKHKSLASSMQDLAVQAERRAKEQFEKEKARAAIEAEKIVFEARKEAESLKTRALMDLQTKKQALETEIASLRQEAELAASTERLKYAKDADHYMMEAQKKIAKDYEEASEYVEGQIRQAQEKAFALVQDAEVRARKTLQEAQDESSRVRLAATDEARQIHQEALKKHSATLSTLQENFHKEMASKREEIIATARQDAEKDRVRIMAEKAQEIEQLKAEVLTARAKLEEEISTVKAELTPLQEKRDATINELKELDSITTLARKELERNNKEVDNVRKMIARLEEITVEREKAEKDLAVLQKRRDDAQKNIDKELEDLRSKSILEFESSKKGQETDLAKSKLRALEEVQKRIAEEEKRYDETRKIRVVELSQRISAKILPGLNDLMEDKNMAGARVKAAIEAATRESLLNEASTFSAPIVDELAPPVKTQEEKKSRNYKIAFAVATAVVVLCMVYGNDIYNHFKTQSATFANEKVEERRIASVFHPEKSPLYGDTYLDNYTDNVLYMKKYYDVKLDILNQQKWLLRFNNDLDLVRSMGLTEDAIVAYTARENSMIERLGKLRDKINAFSPDLEAASIKEMRIAEDEDVTEIKKILKGEANYEKIRKLEEEFVKELIRSN